MGHFFAVLFYVGVFGGFIMFILWLRKKAKESKIPTEKEDVFSFIHKAHEEMEEINKEARRFVDIRSLRY
jgi:hypothetical protein